jgi:hypothetical protein
MNFLTAAVEIKANDSALRKSLPQIKAHVASTVDSMQRRLDTISFKKVALGAAGIASALGVLSFKLTKNAADLVETQNKFEQVFKELTPQAMTFSNELAESVGRSRREMMDFMSVMQDTFVPMGFTRKKALELSSTLTKLGLDVASLNNRMDKTVLENFQSAVVGNVRAVRKYGILISQTAIQQELWNMGIDKQISKATEQEKVLARVNILIKSSKDAMGDAERTAFTFVNQLKRLRGFGLDLAAAIGNYLMPVFNEMLTEFNKWIKANEKILAQKIGEKLKAITETVRDLVMWTIKHKDAILKVVKALAAMFIVDRLIVGFATLKLSFIALGIHGSGVISMLTKLNPWVVAVGASAVITADQLSKMFGEIRDWREAEMNADVQRRKHLAIQMRINQEAKDGTRETKRMLAATKEFINQFTREELDRVWEPQWIIGTKAMNQYFAELEQNRNRHSQYAEDQHTELKRVVDKALEDWVEAEKKMKEVTGDKFITARVQAVKAHNELMQLEKQYNDFKIQQLDTRLAAEEKLYMGIRGASDELLKTRLWQIDMEAGALLELTGREKEVAEWRKQQKEQIKYDTNEIMQAFEGAADTIESSMSSAFQSIIKHEKSFKEGFDDIMRSVVDSVTKAVTDMIAQWIRWKIITAASQMIPGMEGMGGMAGTNPFAAGAQHFGGSAGRPGFRKHVNPAVFVGARRMHGGGVAGLAPDEVPTILRKGETVNQEGEGGGAANINFNINAIDTQSGAEFILRNQRMIQNVIGSGMRKPGSPIRKS